MNRHVLQLHTHSTGTLWEKVSSGAGLEARLPDYAMLFQPITCSQQDISSTKAEMAPISLTETLSTALGILEIVNTG